MLPNEASYAPIYLYDWSNTSRVPYSDFLRAKQFERSIRYGIDNQTKQLIASNQQLAEHGIEVLSDNLDSGFTLLSQDIGRVTDAVREGTTKIVNTFNWGFTEVLISLGQMNINLAELVKLTRTPSQTWACEQFEIARDEFRRQLYPEALQSVTRAIEGLGSNSGIKTEFRFHFLVGTIRLGSYKNSSPEIIDPQLAEQAFLAAARYAQADYPANAGESLICAGRAALIQGAIDNAIDHTRKGLAFVPMVAEGSYQLGRALFLKGELSEAMDRLADAILQNVEHALHVANDADFILKKDFLHGVLRQAQERYGERYRKILEQIHKAITRAKDFTCDGISLQKLLSDEFVKCEVLIKDSQDLKHKKNLLAAHDAVTRISEIHPIIDEMFSKYKTGFGVQQRQRAKEIEKTNKEINEEKGTLLIVGIGALIWIFVLIHIWISNSKLDLIVALVFEGIGSGFIIGIGVLVVGFLANLAVKEENKERKSRADQEIGRISTSISAVQNMPDPKFWDATVRVDPHT